MKSKSSGPKTPEGKRRSAQNAIRHGALAAAIVLPNEDPEAFQSLLQGYIQEIQPESQVEFDLVMTMAVARWRQMRLWGIEKAGLSAEIIKQLIDPDADHATRAALAFRTLCDDSRTLDLQSRYEIRFDRQFHRALTRLEARQKNRKLPNELS